MRLILASNSPRRKEILSLLGLAFDVIPSGVEEVFEPGRSPADEARHWAVEKSLAVHRNHPDSVVIGSDTVIDLEGETIGKPAGREDAVRILSLLAGRTHSVATAVAVISPDGKKRVAVETTKVRMHSVPKDWIVRYVATGDSMDKAGAYSIQGEGRRLIDSIEGDYLAAVGFPLRALVKLLTEAGIKPSKDVESVYLERNVMNWQSYNPLTY
jgi:septum formation protein